MHGRSHRPGGSDPIPGLDDAIRFNVDNQGQDDGHLEITARGEVPGSDDAIVIRGLAENGGSGDVTVESEGILGLHGDDAVQIDGGAVAISDPGFLLTTLSIDGAVAQILSNGGTFTIKDHLGAALVTYTG